MDDEGFVDAQGLTDYLDVSLRTVRTWEQEGGIPFHLLPGTTGKRKFRRYRVSEVREWLAAIAPQKPNQYTPPHMGLYRCKSGKNKSDIWYYAVTINGQRIVGSTGTTDYEEAKEIYIRVYHEALEGRRPIKTRIALDQAFKEYLAYSKATHRDKTYKDYCRRSGKLLRYFGEDRKLQTIDVPLIESYRQARRAETAQHKDQPVMGSTINREVMLLQGLFTWAVRNKKASGTPFAVKGAVGKYKEDIGEGKYINPDQQGQLIEASGEKIRAAVVVDLNTGMRLGEIRTLQWRMVNMDKRVIQGVGTKSYKRNIMIGVELLELFKRLPKRSQYVFCHEDGSPLSASYIEKEFEKACEKAGITDFTFHNLRDVFATEYYEKSGKNIVKLKKIIGHRSVKTTERYLAVLGLDSTEEVDAISKGVFSERVKAALGLALGRAKAPETVESKDIMIQ